MSNDSTADSADSLAVCLARLEDGDASAMDELVHHSLGRLRILARRMLAGFSRVRRWEETDDVLQNALVRLMRAVEDVRPRTSRDFFALANLQIRRELIDLARRYFGPQGRGANHASVAMADGERRTPELSDLTNEPVRLAQWCEFHQHVDQLPAEERETVGLLFYQELPQAEAARLLNVSVRTVQRRWQSALVTLHPLVKHALSVDGDE